MNRRPKLNLMFICQMGLWSWDNWVEMHTLIFMHQAQTGELCTVSCGCGWKDKSSFLPPGAVTQQFIHLFLVKMTQCFCGTVLSDLHWSCWLRDPFRNCHYQQVCQPPAIHTKARSTWSVNTLTDGLHHPHQLSSSSSLLLCSPCRKIEKKNWKIHIHHHQASWDMQRAPAAQVWMWDGMTVCLSVNWHILGLFSTLVANVCLTFWTKGRSECDHHVCFWGSFLLLHDSWVDALQQYQETLLHCWWTAPPADFTAARFEMFYNSSVWCQCKEQAGES